MKTSIAKDLLIIVILLAVFSGSYLYIQSGPEESGASADNQMIRQRLQAIGTSWWYNGGQFPAIKTWDAVTQESRTLPAEGKTLVIALGNAGCNPCQIRELRNLDTLYQHLEDQVQVIALYYKYPEAGHEALRYEALQLRKVSNASYPIWYTNDLRLADFMAETRFPTIFLLDNHTVASTFTPIPTDDYFSYKYMQALRTVLAGNRLPVPDLPVEGVRSTAVATDSATWSLISLEGEEVTFAAFRDRVVFLNSWATWCAPCIREMPTVQALYDSLAEEGVAFVIVSNEDKTTVQEFIENQGFTFPVYIQQTPPPKHLQAPGVPATFIIDPEGNVVFEYAGAADWSDERVLQFLRKLTTKAA